MVVVSACMHHMLKQRCQASDAMFLAACGKGILLNCYNIIILLLLLLLHFMICHSNKCHACGKGICWPQDKESLSFSLGFQRLLAQCLLFDWIMPANEPRCLGTLLHGTASALLYPLKVATAVLFHVLLTLGLLCCSSSNSKLL